MYCIWSDHIWPYLLEICGRNDAKQDREDPATPLRCREYNTMIAITQACFWADKTMITPKLSIHANNCCKIIPCTQNDRRKGTTINDPFLLSCYVHEIILQQLFAWIDNFGLKKNYVIHVVNDCENWPDADRCLSLRACSASVVFLYL